MTIIEQSFIIIFMRLKDENKKEAIFQATIQLINEIGHANVSMSKVGKMAGVSPSTIYVYFENKEDMLKKVYLEAKMKFARVMIRNIRSEDPMQQVASQLVKNVLDHVQENESYFLFTEQFADSPLMRDLDMSEVNEVTKQIYKIVERAQKEGILKQLPPELLFAFGYYPVTQIAKSKLKCNLPFSKVDIESLQQMFWDAIKV